MPQDRDTGAAGRDHGLRMARGLSKLLDAKLVRSGANEIVWNGKIAVIKSCRPKTPSVGVTAAMLPRLNAVLAALEDDSGLVTVWEVDAQAFRPVMYDSRSTGSPDGRVQMIRRADVQTLGRPIKTFTLANILEAAERR